MIVSILCSSSKHPINEFLTNWMERNASRHQIELVRSTDDLKGGDLLFLISCDEIINKKIRDLYRKTLLVHASDLPKGRGWSPHIWEILNGATEITLSLLEADDRVDSGDIWKKSKIEILKTDLWDEINGKIFGKEIELMDFAITNFDNVVSVKQDPSVKPTYFRKRTPNDSEIDIDKSLENSFNLLRLADPHRYPAFFVYEGQKYRLYIEKSDD